MALKEKILDVRLEAAREAVQRARWIFLAATVISLAMIVVTYVSSFSWLRGFALQDNWPENDSITKEAQQELLKEWVASQTLSVPLLDAKVSVSDLALLGSLSLSIISCWFFFAARRVHHIIWALLSDNRTADDDVHQLLYHGLVSQFIFLTVTVGDYPTASLDSIPNKHTFHLARPALWILKYLPLIAIGFVVATDLLSLFWLKAPFRPGHEPIARHLNWSSGSQVAIYELSALVLGIATLRFSKLAWKLLRTTSRLLKDYGPTSTAPTIPEE